ncbi:MAG TPA: hypothetical protein DET40_06560 [Lentisphaeria bacterium]|nr:MAG: hypothetical protein A2X45_17565 [Lentisphaerae bacterium GWF2_50_93]HCE43190.1 hypothetical protein [Lentisphaeria bacterium]
MLAVVKTPRIEISMNGPGVSELVAWIGKKFDISIVSKVDDDSMRIEETSYYKEMNVNRTGNLLAGARLKKGLTQKKLSEISRIPQSVISDYEKGRRKITRQAAIRLSSALKIPETYLI